eukprot:g13853.t1
MESKGESAQAQPTSLLSTVTHSQKMERKSERAQSPPSTLSSTDTQSQTERMGRCEPPPHLRKSQAWLLSHTQTENTGIGLSGIGLSGAGCSGWGCLPCSTALPAKLFCPLPWLSLRDGYDEDEDQQPHFKETTHEHTTIQPLERAMRPDSPTHEQGLQEEQKSDQQDEISIEQSLADDQDTNLSTGPMPASDFRASYRSKPVH